jgi:hypothetical protein
LAGIGSRRPNRCETACCAVVVDGDQDDPVDVRPREWPEEFAGDAGGEEVSLLRPVLCDAAEGAILPSLGDADAIVDHGAGFDFSIAVEAGLLAIIGDRTQQGVTEDPEVSIPVDPDRRSYVGSEPASAFPLGVGVDEELCAGRRGEGLSTLCRCGFDGWSRVRRRRRSAREVGAATDQDQRGEEADPGGGVPGAALGSRSLGVGSGGWATDGFFHGPRSWRPLRLFANAPFFSALPDQRARLRS